MSEIEQRFIIARDMLVSFEEDFRRGAVDERIARETLAEVVGALKRRGRPYRLSDKPPRGLGYGKLDRDGYLEPHDAMVVASLPWFKENWSAAIRAQYPNANPDEVRNHADRIKGHKAQIDEIEGERPWETSSNWLGDLPSK